MMDLVTDVLNSCFSTDDRKEPETFYLVPNCFIIGTIDRSK